MTAEQTLRQRPRSRRLQGFSRGQDPRERILALRKMRSMSTVRQRPRSGRLQGFSRGQDPRERILALRTTQESE